MTGVSDQALAKRSTMEPNASDAPPGRCTHSSSTTPSTSATCRSARVLVIKDANYPWLLLVPRRPDIVEIIDLDEVEQAQLMGEITRVARALKEITECDKLNIAALGNVVPQLHVHVIARRTSDAAWPQPVWGVMPPLDRMTPKSKNFIGALAPQDLAVVTMQHSVSFHSGRPAFVTNILDRAAQRRTDHEKLSALGGHRDAASMWSAANAGAEAGRRAAPHPVMSHRRGAEIRHRARHDLPRPRDGAPASALAPAAAVEKLLDPRRPRRHRPALDRGAGAGRARSASAARGSEGLAALARRHRFCANCGTRPHMLQGGWRRDCPQCKVQHFPRTDPVVIMLAVAATMPARPAVAVPHRHVVVPCRLRRAGRDHRGRGRGARRWRKPASCAGACAISPRSPGRFRHRS